LNYINNYVECLNVDDKVAKSFIILAISLNVPHIYFDSLMKNKIILLRLPRIFFSKKK